MTTLIDKTVDILGKQAKKLPQVMILIALFVILFPKEAAKIIDLIIPKIQILLPEAITEFWTKMSFTQKDFLNAWAFLLVLNAFTIIFDFLHQVINDHARINIAVGPALFTINSIIYISVLIYNILYEPDIKISDGQFTDIYSTSVSLAGILFTLLFFAVYGADIFEIYKKVNDPELPIKKRMVFNIIYWPAVGWVVVKLLNIFLQ